MAKLTSHNKSLLERMWLVLLLFGALTGLLAGIVIASVVHWQKLKRQIEKTRSEELATLGRIAAALAHDLRNPLTSMRIIAQSASINDNKVLLDETDFSILEQEIERLDSSIQTFYDYARPPQPEKRTCIVQTLMRQAVSLIERRAKLSRVEIHDDLPAEPMEIEADPGQIKRVLLNILLNALDASPGGGVVTLRSRVISLGSGQANTKQSHSQKMVEIEIADTGTGLPADLRDRIFDAFVSTNETGTGLGLAICKRIIDDHGGEIAARNATDSGAIITVRLPKVQQQPVPETSTTVGH